MRGIACILLVLAACGDDGTPTAASTLMGASPTVKSAYSKSFKGADGTGTIVLGWKIDFVDAGAGTGCKAEGVKVVASIGIFTSQTPDSSHSVADLTTGDISIVLDAPPTAPAMGETANMGVDGIANVEGTVSITGVGKQTDGKTVIKLLGMVNAGGMDSNGGAVILSGTFEAPVCN
jgi:hypothetical protein